MVTRLDKSIVEEHAKGGASIKDIAKSVGASYSGVFNFCKVNHIEVRRHNRLDVDNVKQDISDGMSQNAIAAKYGVVASSVSTFIKTQGLKALYQSMKSARPKRVRRSKVNTGPMVSQEQSDNVAEKQDWATAE